MSTSNDGKLCTTLCLCVKDTPDTLRILKEFQGLLLPPNSLLSWGEKLAWPTFDVDAQGQPVGEGTLTIYIESWITPLELRRTIASLQHGPDGHI